MPETEASILYSDVSTKVEIEAEPTEVPEVDFTNSELEIMYRIPPEGLGFSPANIGRILGIKENSVTTARNREGIPSNESITNPELSQRRREGVRRALAERHDEMMAKVPSEEFQRKHDASDREYWAQNTARVINNKKLAIDNFRAGKEKQKQITLDRKEAMRKAIREVRALKASYVLDHINFPLLPERWQTVLIMRYFPGLKGERPATHESISKSLKHVSRAGVQAIDTRAVRLLDNLGVPISQDDVPSNLYKSINGDSMGRKILDVLCASDDALPVDELVKVAGLKNPGVLYQVISELKAKITGSGLKIVSLYGRGYKLVRISPLQLER